MLSFSWRRAPIIGAALLLLPGVASAQGTDNSDVMPPVPGTALKVVKHAPPKAGALSLKNAWKPNKKGSIFPEKVNVVPGATSLVPNVQKISMPRTTEGPGANAGFGGLGQQADGLRPGNSSVAVSNSFVLQTTEEGLYVFKRDGTPVGGASWNGFLGGTDIKTQPHCIYDHYNNQFVMVLSQYHLASDAGPAASYYSILRTSGDDGLNWGNWINVTVTAYDDGTQSPLIDSPHLAYNASTIYLHINCRDFSNGTRVAYGSAVSSRVILMQSADAGPNQGYYTAGAFNTVLQGFSASNNRANTPVSMLSQKFDPIDPTWEMGYTVHAANSAGGGDQGGNGIRIRRFITKWAQYPGTGFASYYALKDSSPASGAPYFPAGLAYVPAPNAVQPGGKAINTVDCRIQSACYLNNNLDTVSSIALDTGAGPEGASLVWRLDCSGTGLPTPTRISAIGATDYDINYSAPVTLPDGTVDYIVSASSPFGLEPTLFSVGWKAGSSSVDSPTQLTPGASTPDFNQPVTDAWGHTTNPWGMWVGASSDPLDRRQIFATGSYNPGGNTWYTGIFALSYLPQTTVTVPNATGQIGVAGMLSANLMSGGTGVSGATVSFWVDGTSAGSGVTDGSGNASVSYTPASGSVGAHTISASFAGDTTHLASGTAMGTLTVNKADTTITTSDVSGTPGQTVALNATLTRTADSLALSGKSITVKVDGTEVAGSPATTDGSGNISVSYPIAEGTVGSHSVTFAFAGDGDYNANSGSSTLTVSKGATSVAVAYMDTYPGAAVTVSAKLTRNVDGGALSGRTLTLKAGTVTVGTAVTDATGTASKAYTIPTATPVGTLVVTGSFAGDADYTTSTGSSTWDIDKKTAITSANVSGNVGAVVSIKATLKAGSTAINGATITFWVDGSSIGTATTLSTGIATLSHTITEAAGNHVLTMTFAGDGTNAPATSPNYVLTAKPLATTLTVNSPTSAPGGSVTFTSTLKNGANLLSGKTITFSVDGSAIGTGTTNASGVATLVHTVTEGAGSHPVNANFAGDAVYAVANANGTLTVKKTDTKTTPSAVAGKPGATATLKATVKAGTVAIVGEMVTFQIDGVTVGTPNTDSTGLAQMTYKIPEGVGSSHSFTATYAGDGTYNGSTGTAAVTITQAATKLTGEVLTKPAGSSVDLGAKLVRTTDSTGLAGKTVGFYDSTGATLIGSGTTDVNGRASITVTAPAKNVTVKYVVKFAGDTNYTASPNGTASVKGS